MSTLSRSTLMVGGLLLSHACYSAHEYTHLLSPNAAAAGVASNTNIANSTSRQSAFAGPKPTFSISSLPMDITAEVLVALFLLTLGIVLSSESLKPVRWGEWAAEVEHGKHGRDSKYLKKLEGNSDLSVEELGQQLYGGPTQEGFGYLENGRRMGFFDVRAKRKEFAEWVKKGGDKEESKQ